MRKWIAQRRRAALMNRVLRGNLTVRTDDTIIDVARFSYVDKEHVEVTWKIHDYCEGINGYPLSESFDAEVTFVVTLDEAAAILDDSHYGPFSPPIMDNTYLIRGVGHVPLNILRSVDTSIAMPCLLTAKSGGRSVSVMTLIEKTNPADAMIRLRSRAMDLYRANLKEGSLSYV